MATGVHLWSQTAGTNATADTSINWAEGQAPSSVNDSARAMMARVADLLKDYGGLTTAGTSTAYTVTTNRAFASAAVMDGAIIVIKPHTTSAAAPTLAVDGLTARAINSATGVAVATGALVSGTPYAVIYIHASTEFILVGYINTFGNLVATGTLNVTSTITGGSVSAGSAAGAMIATQAQQETGSATDVLVTPGRQHFHLSAAKALATFSTTGSIVSSYNVSSITDSGVGDQTVNFTTAFSSANYFGYALSTTGGGVGLRCIHANSDRGASTTAFALATYNSANALADPNGGAGTYAAFFGDQ